jgi:mycothiol synthase
VGPIRSDLFITRPATLEDAEVVANLLNACSVEQGGTPSVTTQTVRAGMQMPGHELATDTLLIFDRGEQTVGFALVQESPPSPQVNALAEVHPQHRGRGAGTVLCRWIEERARQAIANVPAGRSLVVHQKRPSTDEAARDLLTSHGYQVVRYYYRMAVDLTAPPPQPAVPEGIVIRPFVRDDEGRALIAALQEAFRENWGYVDRPLELEYERWMHLLDRDDDPNTARHWLVAVDEPEIAGLALSRLQEGQDLETAWIYIVGVRPAWRRRGIALALLQQSFWALHQRGKRRAALEVDAQSPTGATRLYERAGMHVERRHDLWEKELPA